MAASRRDPHYRAILDALETRDLHPGDFEAIAGDLLRSRYPTLVPVTGGQDGGFDGAVADLEEEAYPLIVTTGRNAARSLKESLESYLNNQGPRRKAIFVTSRRLTPGDQRELKEIARGLGFALVQIYEQRGIAALLYRDSQSCLALLGVSSAAPKLSALPPRQRGDWTELPLLGRERDLSWLLSTPGDRILVAPSGFGKTYLLYWMASQEEHGLFIATQSRDELAAAIRDQKPDLLFVDDNGFDPEWLEQILALRRNQGHFDIVATCWPSNEDALLRILGPQAKVGRLEGLRRADILEILKSLGVADEDWLRELADQAVNRPGLAVTLANFARSESWREVFDGRAALRELRQPIEKILGQEGPEAIHLLAVLSLGDVHGVERRPAAELLEIPDRKAAQLLTGLETTGILVETSSGSESLKLAVQPEQLRLGLVATTFFGGAGQLDVRPCLQRIEGLGPIRILLKAAHGGIPVDRQLLLHEIVRRTGKLGPPSRDFFLYEESKTADLWRDFALLGPHESRLVLAQYPGDRFGEVARALLEHLPEETLQRLLDSDRASESSVLDPIRGWVTPSPLGLAEAMQRRHRLLGFLEKRVERQALSAVDQQAALLALSPNVGGNHMAASRDAIQFFEGSLIGLVSDEDLGALVRRAFELLAGLEGPLPWPSISQAFDGYRWPARQFPEIQERGFQLVRDALNVLREKAGESITQRLAWLELAQVFEMPAITMADIRAGSEAELVEAELLLPNLTETSAELPIEWLSRWANEKPGALFDRWRPLLREARTMLPHRYGNLRRILDELAPRVQDPDAWIEGMVSAEVPEMSLRPFLSRLDSAGFERQARRLLVLTDYRWEIALETFRRGDSGVPLEEAIVVLEHELVRLRSDLRHDREMLRSFVASPACNFNHKTPLQWILASAIAANPHFQGEPVQEAAQAAILGTPALPLLPSGVWAMNCGDFGRNPDFAAKWLIALSGIPSDFQLGAGEAWLALREEIRQLIAFRLSPDDKRSILQWASLSFIEFFASQLVARDSTHYRLLAERGASESALLLPLTGFRPQPEWVPFTKIALERGITPQQVAQYSIELGMGGSAAQIEAWMAFLQEIESEHPDLALVISTSLDLARRLLDRRIESQKQIEMSGLAAGS